MTSYPKFMHSKNICQIIACFISKHFQSFKHLGMFSNGHLKTGKAWDVRFKMTNGMSQTVVWLAKM